MAQSVTVWRAAQLVGVSRRVLQSRIRDGELGIHDGQVSTDELLRLYPQAQFEESGLLERVTRIREDAFGRRLRERILPSQEVLAQRLFSQSQELADLRRHLEGYHSVLAGLREAVLAQSRAAPQDAVLQELARLAHEALARALSTDTVNVLDAMDDMLKVMNAQVTLRPSGHQFNIEGHETLLQAGLRSGCNLNYGCGNGTCGMCKVRVVAGEVIKVQPFDYPLTENERLQGYTLMCAHTAASSTLTLETLEAGGPQDIAAQSLVAQLRQIRPLGADTCLMHLQTPRSHRLRFLAGQSVTLGLAGLGIAPSGGEVGDLAGTYPVASCPCDDRNLHFLIGRDPDDAFAQRVLDGSLPPGTAVSVRGPVGDFVLASGRRRQVFAACDLGFAPVKSLIESALSRDDAPPISLFWLATRPDGHVMSNQCRAWSEALESFEHALSTHTDPRGGALSMVEAMRADLFDIDCEFYLAGPRDFVATLHESLRAAGVVAAHIHTETL